MHAESNATPSMEFEVAAASFLVLFVFVVDSQLGNCMLLSLLLFVRFLEAYLADPVPHGHPWTPGAHFWLIGLPSTEWGFCVGENLVSFICFSVYVPAGAFCIVGQDFEL